MSTNMDYVQILVEEGEEPIELPTETDRTLLFSTLQAQYPGVCGLKYRNVETRAWRGLRLDKDRFYPPANETGWGKTRYCCVYPRENKRKSDENLENPATKTKRVETPRQCSDIVVHGLSFRTTEDSLREYFEKHGKLVLTQVIMDPKTRQSKGYGYVCFSSYESQVRVLATERHFIDGRLCEVSISKSKKARLQEMLTKIYVSNCTEDITANDLREHFSKFGQVIDVYVPRPFRSFAFVKFLNEEIAQALAVRAEAHIIKGVSVSVSMAIPKTEAYSNRNNFPNSNNYNISNGKSVMRQTMNCPNTNQLHGYGGGGSTGGYGFNGGGGYGGSGQNNGYCRMNNGMMGGTGANGASNGYDSGGYGGGSGGSTGGYGFNGGNGGYGGSGQNYNNGYCRMNNGMMGGTGANGASNGYDSGRYDGNSGRGGFSGESRYAGIHQNQNNGYSGMNNEIGRGSLGNETNGASNGSDSGGYYGNSSRGGFGGERGYAGINQNHNGGYIGMRGSLGNEEYGASNGSGGSIGSWNSSNQNLDRPNMKALGINPQGQNPITNQGHNMNSNSSGVLNSMPMNTADVAVTVNQRGQRTENFQSQSQPKQALHPSKEGRDGGTGVGGAIGPTKSSAFGGGDSVNGEAFNQKVCKDDSKADEYPNDQIASYPLCLIKKEKKPKEELKE